VAPQKLKALRGNPSKGLRNYGGHRELSKPLERNGRRTKKQKKIFFLKKQKEKKNL
jgi:hypothetical protein